MVNSKILFNFVYLLNVKLVVNISRKELVVFFIYAIKK